MSRYIRKSKKTPVARRATPDVQIRQSPPLESLKTLFSADEVLTERHKVLSWDVIAHELGIKDRGTLSRVANGKREASAKLIKKLNGAYGCHLHVKTIKADIPVCEFCDQPYTPRHRCKDAPTKYPWHPVRSRPVSDRMAIAALGALYAQRGIGEAFDRYRVELEQALERMTG